MLERIFITNWKTTACGALLLLVWVTFLFGKLTETGFLTIVAPIIAGALALSKDGVREETVVAREDVPPTTAGSSSSGVVLLVIAAALYSCARGPLPIGDATGERATPAYVRADSSQNATKTLHFVAAPDCVVVVPAPDAPVAGTFRAAVNRFFSPVGRIGKKSTVNYYYGAANVTTAGKRAVVANGDNARTTAAQHSRGPVIGGDSSTATDLSGAQASAAIHGNGNSPKLTNTAPAAPGIGATIAAKLTGPPGIVLGLAALVLLLYAGSRYYAYRKAKNTLTNS